MKINWSQFFIDSIDAIQNDLAYICSQASGCREGWPKGRFFWGPRRTGTICEQMSTLSAHVGKQIFHSAIHRR